MNVVMIISDTFRRDHVGCYGNSWIRTPNLDRLAKQSTVFDRCYTTSYPTVPNRADLLTGKYTFAYFGWGPLPDDERTLPQLLSDAGYSTMGIVDTPFYVRNGYGYDRGFDDFLWNRGQHVGPERDAVTETWRYEEDRFAPSTLAAAEKWIERHYREEFFLLVDTWDPHEPWDPPAHYVEMYLKDYDGRPSPWPCYCNWRKGGLPKEDVERAHAHYCGEITMVDRWVGRLLERIESLGLMEDTVVIFTSDHGFYFGEHDMFGKGIQECDDGVKVGAPPGRAAMKGQRIFRDPATGKTSISVAHWGRSPLYEELTRIPLLIYVPKAKPGRTDALVCASDLMPTVLDLAGVTAPDTVQGASLTPLLRGERDRLHDFAVTSWPFYDLGESIRVVDDWERKVDKPLLSAITDGEWTLLYAIAGEPVELYNTVTDPEQQQNVFTENHELARELHAKFVKLLTELGTKEAFLAPRRQLL